MVAFFAWWVMAEVIALAAFPLAFRLFAILPDRGYTAAKPLGLLLTAYLFWIAGSVGLTSNDRGSAIFVLLVVLLAGAALAFQQRQSLISFVGQHRGYILIVELIFLVIFAWFAYLRAFTPDIAATEKPFELAFLNGVTHTTFFPPQDPWYSGFSMNYYYFGYVNVEMLDRLTGIGNGIGFNLGTPLTAALAGVTIFGFVYGLVRSLGAGSGHRRAIAFGLAAIGLLLVVSSLEGVLELAEAHGIGSAGFFQSLDIGGLQAGKTSSTWYPNDAWSFWWWWHATRMASQWNILEFPYFSFLLGDLHPHVMVIPFTLLTLMMIWVLFSGNEALDGHWWRRNPLFFAVFSILVGALALLNAWDQPAEIAIVFLAALMANARRLSAWNWPALRASILFMAPVVVLAVVLYLPYWLVFQSPDFIGISPTMLTTAPPGDIRAAMSMAPFHLLLFWGPMFWVSLSFLLVHLWRTRAFRLPPNYLATTFVACCVPLFVWAIAVVVHVGLSGLQAELSARGSGLLTEVILVALVFLALTSLLREALPDNPRPSAAAVQFALGMVAIGLLFIYGTELFFVVQKLAPARANTVFKFWYQSWILQSIGGAAGLAYIVSEWRPRLVLVRPPRLAWAGVTAVLMLAALVYPVIATPARTHGFSGTPDLNGLNYWQQFDPASFDAANWLSAHAQGSPVVLEAEGGDLAGTYSPEGGRISELSGLPTVLAWSQHEGEFHPNLTLVNARSQAIKTIYTTTNANLAETMLNRYDVHYVVVGTIERQLYGDSGMTKFAQLGAPVYQTPQITIYDLTQPLPLAGQR